MYFSQGQAVYDPQDPAKSKSVATRDFLTQAVTQAVASFLSPSQMGSKFGPLQEKILNQPERYVVTYNIFTEGASNGLYNIRGQAGISMDSLKKDLVASGFVPAGADRSEPVSQTMVPPASSENQRASDVGRAQKDKQEQTTSRGMLLSRRELVWAVAEKWEQEWLLPQGRNDSRAIFAMSLIQESQNYAWSLSLPQSGALSLDNAGNVPSADVLSLAKRMGITKVIVGAVTSKGNQNQNMLIDLSLRILDAASGRLEGEIHKELPLNGSSYQEGAMDLAAFVGPQIDRLLHERPQPEPSQDVASVQRSGAVQGIGEWTVIVKGDQQYANWEELEKILLEQFKSMKIKNLELGAGSTKVRVDGIDGQYLNTLQGTQLGSGALVQVTGFSPEARSINLMFSRP
ncbi:MAG: hypothetical protein AB2L11_12850 [Syntrophobacteraceae bacterium]